MGQFRAAEALIIELLPVVSLLAVACGDAIVRGMSLVSLLRLTVRGSD